MRLVLLRYVYSMFLWTWFRRSIRIRRGCIDNDMVGIGHHNETRKHRSILCGGTVHSTAVFADSMRMPSRTLCAWNVGSWLITTLPFFKAAKYIICMWDDCSICPIHLLVHIRVIMQRRCTYTCTSKSMTNQVDYSLPTVSRHTRPKTGRQHP